MTNTQKKKLGGSFIVMFGINRGVQLGSGYCFVLLVADRESVLIVLVTRLCELSVGLSTRWRGKKILTSSQTLLISHYSALLVKGVLSTILYNVSFVSSTI